MQYFVKEMTRENVTLTAYIHDKSKELSNADKRPAVLIFPGGGYVMCSDREAEPVALAYMAEGYQAFVLRYTVGKDAAFQDAYDDAREAFMYLMKNGEELGVDTEKIAVAGFSAGGHLAASLSVMSGEKPKAVILGCPVTLDDMGMNLNKTLPSVPEKVTSQTPPAYIFTTSTDELVPVRNSLKLAEALEMDWRNIGINTPLSVLLKREDCRQILNDQISGLEQMLEACPSARLYSLEIMNQYSPDIITDEILSVVKQRLFEISTKEQDYLNNMQEEK